MFGKVSEMIILRENGQWFIFFKGFNVTAGFRVQLVAAGREHCFVAIGSLTSLISVASVRTQQRPPVLILDQAVGRFPEFCISSLIYK